ncbi:hypothetical protein HYV11_01800 [Candidatus Dependentiae bacterium]|nr:hypothetical protein [Candidatus Dependentiae bacterium]
MKKTSRFLKTGLLLLSLLGCYQQFNAADNTEYQNETNERITLSITRAMATGNKDMVKSLLPYAGKDPKDINYIVKYAARHGYENVVNAMLAKIKEHENKNNTTLAKIKIFCGLEDKKNKLNLDYTLPAACFNGHSHIVAQLVNYGISSSFISSGLANAIIEGHDNLIDILLPQANTNLLIEHLEYLKKHVKRFDHIYTEKDKIFERIDHFMTRFN